MDLFLTCWGGQAGTGEAGESEVAILNAPATNSPTCVVVLCDTEEQFLRGVAGVACDGVLLRKHFPRSVVFGPGSGCFTKHWAPGIEEGFPQALGFGSISCFPVAA